MVKILMISCLFLQSISTTEKKTSIINQHDMGNKKADTIFSIHRFKVNQIDGGTIDFSLFKGKKILIVNTASACGYTPQYKELQELFDLYKEKLMVVGFPANDFGGQEPGSNADIQVFCAKNYGVTFPMAAKISVTGKGMAPIYQYLTQKEQNGVLNAEIKWNFNKFLIDETGIVIKKFESSVSPMSKEIISLL